MQDLIKSLLLATALAVPSATFAQDTATSGEAAQAEAPAEAPAETAGSDTPAGANELSLGEEVRTGPQVGDTYIRDTYGDWELRCVKTEDGRDPCQLYQLLADETGNAVAEINLFGLQDGGQAAAGATIITPLETLLTQNITLSVDGGAAKRYPFTWCSQIGCVARVGFTQAEVDSFKRGAKGTLVIVPVAAPDQQVILTVSLTGFTAAFDAVNASNRAVAESAPKE
ncbi:invasion associated locus B family protein [Pseudoruegeria sp. SHC-113]|uniref:invasion associated locus B family protein n=1 Tax=Pseudoruegeria sp. SHC-113 TaxID=2855439 RepID=UPI0021BB7A9D|nr:invasion associated locus B family protein [Pseudoruegeria sp. SHC-113]MCT8160559.1 invasion associated locus B family protein [Pseudoruegeria sp. SHC-113]